MNRGVPVPGLQCKQAALSKHRCAVPRQGEAADVCFPSLPDPILQVPVYMAE